MAGLLLGYAFSFPMNWMLLQLGWKHGMGHKSDARRVKSPAATASLFGGMIIVGVLSLALPAWLTVLRRSPVTSVDGEITVDLTGSAAIVQGFNVQLALARRSLQQR